MKNEKAETFPYLCGILLNSIRFFTFNFNSDKDVFHMRVKRILAAALTLTLVCGVLPAPTLAAEGKLAPFVDVQDPQVAEAAEFLRLMGVVDGTGDNAFTPDRILTRAEFCKMAVELMGNGDKVAAQMNRTVFRDVPSTHWARGYINVATQVSGTGENTTPAIIRGDATGLFHPDDYITTAEAVTILMRVLNYSDSTVGFGATWYDGYMSTAASVGLTEGLSLAASDTVTRGQTAILLYNLYFTELRDSKDTYFTSKGGKEVEDAIVLDVNAKADDGTSGAFETTEGKNKTNRTFDASLTGTKGKVLLDKDERVLAFVPKSNTSQRVVNILSAEATYLTASGGEKLTVEPDTVVYREGKESTWKETYENINSATPVTFHYDANGKLSYLFFSSYKSEDSFSSMVARNVPNNASNPFASMASGGSYTMFKNGIAATAADIRQYDVATYDPGTRVIQVSDLKLSGIYENASPSPNAPLSITVMKKEFPILPSARNDIAGFKIGDKITLLLTTDNQVAGVVSVDVVKGDAVGEATVDGTNATVTLLQSGLVVSGTVSAAAERYDGQLVNVSSSAIGRLSLSAISGSAAKADLDVGARKLGDREIAENAVIYDRVKDGAPVEIKYDGLTLTSIPRSKISFVSYDYAGRVKCLVLDDVTGDAYTYGYLNYNVEKKLAEKLNPNDPDSYYDERTIWVRYATGSDSNISETESDHAKYLSSVRAGVPGGIAYTSSKGVASVVTLQSLTHVNRTAFDMDEMTVTVAGVSYPISKDIQCYNKTTKTWFAPGEDGLKAARAYSDDLTLYYDRAPSEGGKIRMIVVP
jgi:hypothetical protein